VGTVLPGIVSGEVKAGDPIPAARQLAADQASCVELIEAGEYGGPAPTLMPIAPTPYVAKATDRSVAAAPPCCGYQHSVQYDVRWWDPVGLKVSSASPYVLWNSNGSSVTACAGNTATSYLTQTGWYEAARSPSIYYANGNTDCVEDAFVHHVNNTFQTTDCMPGVDVYYNRVRVIGHANGGSSGTPNSYVTGNGCQMYLHWDTVGPYSI